MSEKFSIPPGSVLVLIPRFSSLPDLGEPLAHAITDEELEDNIYGVEFKAAVDRWRREADAKWLEAKRAGTVNDKLAEIERLLGEVKKLREWGW